MRRLAILALSGFVLAIPALADDRDSIISYLDAESDRFGSLARQIWEEAEVGYQETESSALLRRALADEGFSIEQGVADIPTAFVASYGSGEPVIAFLAEFDALDIDGNSLRRTDRCFCWFPCR